MTGLRLVAVIENIPLNIKNSMKCAKKWFFIILATEISGMPATEICFLPGQFRWTILPKEHQGESLGVCELFTQPSNWEAVTPPPSYRRRSEIFVANAQVSGECYVQLGHYWETNDTRKRFKLALTIYRDSMQKILSGFERRGNKNRKQLEP